MLVETNWDNGQGLFRGKSLLIITPEITNHLTNPVFYIIMFVESTIYVVSKPYTLAKEKYCS